MSAPSSERPDIRSSARRLLHWCDLDDRRRRQARSGLLALPSWIYSIFAGMVLAAEVARGWGVFGSSSTGGNSATFAGNLWLAVLMASHIAVLCGAPFRMFWRRDSAFLGRSAISGQVLFSVALIRSMRASVAVAIPCALAACAFALGPNGSLDIMARRLVLVGVAALNAGLLGPAVALAAGAVVASDQAQAALGSIAGEYQAPKTSWLGVLPGLAGTAMALAIIATAQWSRGGSTSPVGDPRIVLAVFTVLPVLAALWAYSKADKVMLAATREVAALDQERLAHVEKTGPSAIERAMASILRGPGARLLFEKDASLARRRYPIPFFLGFVGLACLWILAAVRPQEMLFWAGAISGGIGAYGLVMARRIMTGPIEHPRLLQALPISKSAASAAKRMRVTSWVMFYMVAGGVPVIARSGDAITSAILLGTVSASTLVIGWILTSAD